MKNLKMNASLFLATGMTLLHVSCADPKSQSIESRSSSLTSQEGSQTEDSQTAESQKFSQDDYPSDPKMVEFALRRLDLAEADFKNVPGAPEIVSTGLEDFLASKDQEHGAALGPPAGPGDAKDALQEARKFQQLLFVNGKITDFSRTRELIKDLAKSLKGAELSSKIDEILKATLASLEKQKSAIRAAHTLNRDTLAKLQDFKMIVLKNCLPAKGILGDRAAFLDQLCKVVPKLDLCSKLGELKMAVSDRSACEKSIGDLRGFVKASGESLKTPAAP